MWGGGGGGRNRRCCCCHTFRQNVVELVHQATVQSSYVPIHPYDTGAGGGNVLLRTSMTTHGLIKFCCAGFVTRGTTSLDVIALRHTSMPMAINSRTPMTSIVSDCERTPASPGLMCWTLPMTSPLPSASVALQPAERGNSPGRTALTPTLRMPPSFSDVLRRVG